MGNEAIANSQCALIDNATAKTVSAGISWTLNGITDQRAVLERHRVDVIYPSAARRLTVTSFGEIATNCAIGNGDGSSIINAATVRAGTISRIAVDGGAQ